MKITNITKSDLNNSYVYYYTNENNQEISSRKTALIKENSGYYLVPGEIKLHDQSKYPALLGISSDDGGEMFEYYLQVGKNWLSNKDDLKKKMNKTKEDIFPFTYHLNVKAEGDIHTDNQY